MRRVIILGAGATDDKVVHSTTMHAVSDWVGRARPANLD